MEQEIIEKRKRGGCLTTYIIFMLVVSGIGLLLNLLAIVGTIYIPDFIQEYGITMSEIFLDILILGANISGCILILNWRKLGVYLIIATYVVDFIYRIYDLSVNGSGSSTRGGTIIGLIIFYHLIKKVYKHMK